MAVHAPNHDDLLVDWDFLLSLYLLTHTASTATIHSFVFFFFDNQLATTNLLRAERWKSLIYPSSKLCDTKRTETEERTQEI